MTRMVAAGVICAGLMTMSPLTATVRGDDHYQAGLKAMKAGEYDNAATQMRRALAAAEKAGETSHEAIEATVGLSNAFIALERTTEAGLLLEHALLMLAKALEATSADLAQIYNSLGIIRTLEKTYPEAESLLKRALAVREKALGADHPDVAGTLNELANLYLVQEKYPEAETAARRVLAIREKSPETRPLDLAKVYRTLAGLNAIQDRLAEADRLFRRVLALEEEALGPDDLAVGSTLMEIASLRLLKSEKYVFLTKAQNPVKAEADKVKSDADFAETVALLKRSLVIREKSLAADDPKILKIIEALAVSYTGQADYVHAEPFLNRLIAARQKSLDSDVTDFLDLLVTGTMEQHKYREAIPLLKRLIAAKHARKSDSSLMVNSLDALRLPHFALDSADEDLKDAPDDHEAMLRKAIRLSELADDPASSPNQADLLFFKKLGLVPGEAALQSLAELTNLMIGGQPIDDSGMPHLRGLVNLKRLVIQPARLTRTRANITDAGLAPLRKLTDLRNLTLTGTTIQGAGLVNLAGMAELNHLDLGFTFIDDAGLEHLPSLPKLGFLNLSGTKITDKSVPILKRLSSLSFLGLLDTKLSNAGVAELQEGNPNLSIHEPGGGNSQRNPAVQPFLR